ncbi:MAG: flavodoxin family protein [Dehalococcoidia bacterium]
MKVLGIVGSYRRQGNTEVLVKEALMAAEEEGAQVDVLRLNNYNIESCRGDGRCESGIRPCHIQDDFNYLLDRIYQNDGIILGVPCYFLAAPGIFKLFLDRTVSVGYPTSLLGKPAAILVPYGNRGYINYALVQPNILLLKWGMKVVDQAIIQSGPPGDAMLNERALARARSMGKAVVGALKTGDSTFRGDKGLCPVCHDRNIRIFRDMETVECPTCSIRGKLTLVEGKIQVTFTEEDAQRGRYSAEDWYRHHMYHVEPGLERFIATKELRKGKRGKYSDYLGIDKKESEVASQP